MKKALLALFFIFIVLSSSYAELIDESLINGSKEAELLLSFSTSPNGADSVEIGFSQRELEDNDFSSIIDSLDRITLEIGDDARARYNGDLYIYYRVRYTGSLKIELLANPLTGLHDSIDIIAFGQREDKAEEFRTGGTGRDVLYESTTVFEQDNTIYPVADSLFLNIESENLLSSASGTYSGELTLRVISDEELL